jgi:large subunit ribosomal protein L2
MGIRYYKPTSPGRRLASVSDFAELTDKNKKPEKSLTAPLKKTGGSNRHGFITCRRRGGGHKRTYRIIDFLRNDCDAEPAVVTHIEYDPNRSARIALIVYPDEAKRYIIVPEGLRAGMTVQSGPGAEAKLGNCLPLMKIPTGLQTHNIELVPGGGAKFCRSAEVFATLTAREGSWAQITLPSGEVRHIPAAGRATIGAVGNAVHMKIRLGKAGPKRWMGRRPHVRGTAMNPNKHPMGGGEGRSKGHTPRSPTGVLAKGGKTRRRRKPPNAMIIRHRISVRYGQLKV